MTKIKFIYFQKELKVFEEREKKRERKRNLIKMGLSLSLADLVT